ncbi:glycoside hydrolase family 19 protein [Streptomyces prunicolor]
MPTSPSAAPSTLLSAPEANDRIGYYQRYTSLLNVDPGTNLDCATDRPFN